MLEIDFPRRRPHDLEIAACADGALQPCFLAELMAWHETLPLHS